MTNSLPAMLVLMALVAPRCHGSEYAELVDGLLNVWESHDVVCLGEDHGSKPDSDLRIALVSNPRFVHVVDVVIVEFGNSVHQAILDRYLLDLEAVEDDELAMVWRDTSAPMVWESPVYAAFLHALRAANTRAERAQRVRVLGGEVPVDWARARSGRDLLPLLNRGSYPAILIGREVLDRGLKALVIFGASHCDRREGFGGDLASTHPGRVWVGFTYYSLDHIQAIRRISSSPSPVLIPVLSTLLAAQPARELFPLLHQSGDPGNLGQVLDGIVHYGQLEVGTVAPLENSISSAFALELSRRAALMSEFREIVLREHPELLDED